MPLSLEDRRARLAGFLALNPKSSVENHPRNDDVAAIIKPWGDDSLIISVPDVGADEFISRLNCAFLPERFSAVYHGDINAIEFVYGLYPNEDVIDRKFRFIDGKDEYVCEFSDASPLLCDLAEYFYPTGISMNEHRNLFNLVSNEKKKPISFWIRGIIWDEDGLIRISKQLNFNMRYFDQRSPVILIHNPKSESGNIAGVRYPHERFPDVIVNRDIDDAMMSFWQASLSGDPARRFLYNYQILEYSAFYFLEENIRRSVRRAVAAPHALDRLDRITVEVIEAVSTGKLSDPQKIEAVMKAAVSPAQVWQEIHANIDFFCKSTTFEGGYEAPAVAKPNWTAGDFETNWLPTMSGVLRGIRNALSHGREQRMSSVIMPTAHNLALLRNWLPPISVIAREIMLYRNVG